ncbi:hypothetical protein D9M69_641350 [compost metagenome]
MAVVEGQLQGVVAGRFQPGQADVQLAVLEDGLAVALHLRRRRVHAQELGAELIALVRSVFQLQGPGGFVQLDGGGDAHGRGSGWQATGYRLQATGYRLQATGYRRARLLPAACRLKPFFKEYSATGLRPGPVRRGGR